MNHCYAPRNITSDECLAKMVRIFLHAGECMLYLDFLVKVCMVKSQSLEVKDRGDKTTKVKM